MHIKHMHEMIEDLTSCTKSAIESNKTHIGQYPISEVVDMIKDLSTAEYYARISKAMEEAEEEDEAEEKYMLQRMKEEYGEDDGQRYYNDWRYANGRYAPRGKGSRTRNYTELKKHDVMYPIEVYRDWDRWNNDGIERMYYTAEHQANSHMDNGQSYSDGYNDGNTRGYEDGYARGRSEAQRMTQRDIREGRSGQSRRTYMESKELHADNSPESKQAKMKDLEKYMNELSSDMSEMISGASNEEKTMLKAKLQNLQQKIQ